MTSDNELRDRIADALHGHFELEAIGPMGCRHEQGSDEEHVADVALEVLRTDEAVERVARLLACLEPGEEWPRQRSPRRQPHWHQRPRVSGRHAGPGERSD